MKAEKPANATYTKILDAAKRLTQLVNYNDMTVRGICAEAGVSVGSFYHFFESKGQMLATKALVNEEETADEIRKSLDGYPTYEKLMLFTERYAGMNLEAGIEEVKSLFDMSGMWYRRRQPVVHVLEDIIEEGRSGGALLATISSDEMTDYFIDCLRGVTYNWCMQNGGFDLTARMRAYVNILFHAFKKVV